MESTLLSFVIPCYHSSATVGTVVGEIECAVAGEPGYTYEIVLVNDDPSDGTFGVLRGLCTRNPRIRAVNLARNFGQHAALMAGFRQARGEIIICLDDDGQTPADEVMKLVRALGNSVDVVIASYEEKRHSRLRNLGSALNEWMARYLLGKPKGLYLSSYFAMRRFIADEVARYDGAYPYIEGLILRATSAVVNVPVTHRERTDGRSGYTFKKLLALWINGFTAFSVKPLRVSTFIGLLFAAVGFCAGLYLMVRQLISPSEIMGWSSTMVALLVIGGLILASLGLIGEYIGRLYISINKAPQYVVREVAGGEAEDTEEREELPDA